MFRIKVEITKMLGKSRTKRDKKFRKLKAETYAEDDIMESDIGLVFKMFTEVIKNEWNKKYPNSPFYWQTE